MYNYYVCTCMYPRAWVLSKRLSLRADHYPITSFSRDIRFFAYDYSIQKENECCLILLCVLIICSSAIFTYRNPKRKRRTQPQNHTNQLPRKRYTPGFLNDAYMPHGCIHFFHIGIRIYMGVRCKYFIHNFLVIYPTFSACNLPNALKSQTV